MKAKKRSAAQVREDCLVYDKPVILQHYDTVQHIWSDAAHIHASINRAVSTGGQSPSDSAHGSRYLFKLRYYAALDSVRAQMQMYRISYGSDFYEIADYDDYNERHSVIKLAADMLRTGTLTLITETLSADAIGQQISTETTFAVPCNEYEVTQDERAVASQDALVPALRVRIIRCEYSGERFAEYGGVRYEIGAVRYIGDAADLYLGERIGVQNA